jgi:hypothetical protein
MLKTEGEIVAICAVLIGDGADLTAGERALLAGGHPVPDAWVSEAHAAIAAGGDPLGDAFQRVRPGPVRRIVGAVYTPPSLVNAMVAWLKTQPTPARIIDPGTGSGRFLLAAAEAFPAARLISIDIDPLATLMLRANLTVRGWLDRANINLRDYRRFDFGDSDSISAFVGNPPFVRHHLINSDDKTWYAENFSKFGIKASTRAGLHLHFFLQTHMMAAPGDIGAFITSSEWMDVLYGSSLRSLLLERMGLSAIHVLDPTIEAFEGTATTAAITCFRVGDKNPAIRMRSIQHLDQLESLQGGVDIPRMALETERKWSVIVRPEGQHSSGGSIEIGDLFRVHRGQVTGANDVWIAGKKASHPLPSRVLIPCVTKARDLIRAGHTLRSDADLKCVIDLPADLSSFSEEESLLIQEFLRWAKTKGAHESYTATHRATWWSVGLNSPAAILCTYMARRAPQFTVNQAEVPHLNIAHGLYPRGEMSADEISSIVRWLNLNINAHDGRRYAGGLSKFEPGEIMRLRMPALWELDLEDQSAEPVLSISAPCGSESSHQFAC